MLVRIGCAFDYAATWPTPLVMLAGVAAADGQRVCEEVRLVEPRTPVHEYRDGFENRVWRTVIPQGEFRITYDALVEISPDPDPVVADAPQTPVADLPDETIALTLPSRYCQSDLLSGTAWNLFGPVPPGWTRVQAICDWIHMQVRYKKGSTTATTAVDVFEARAGVCRDFAHLGITFCRAMNIPARYVFGYLPDIGIVPVVEPMDFHAWFEAYVDGQWRTFDARHNVPRIGRIVVARGRDAVDVAMATTYGSVRLAGLEVWADEVDDRGRVLSGLNLGKILRSRGAVEAAR